MKVFRLLVLLAVLILGLIIGAVNMTAMSINLLFTQLHTSVGVDLIAALLVGVVVGAGLVLVSVVIPLYGQLRRANKSAAARDGSSLPGISPAFARMASWHRVGFLPPRRQPGVAALRP